MAALCDDTACLAGATITSPLAPLACTAGRRGTCRRSTRSSMGQGAHLATADEPSIPERRFCLNRQARACDPLLELPFDLEM